MQVNVKYIKRLITNLDKAIMEMKTEQGSTHATIIQHNIGYLFLNDVKGLRTLESIKKGV